VLEYSDMRHLPPRKVKLSAATGILELDCAINETGMAWDNMGAAIVLECGS